MGFREMSSMILVRKTERVLRHLVLLFCVCFLLGFGTARSADLNDAYLALQERDYTKAAGIFQVLANAGNVQAQYELGYLYFYGLGVEKDLKKSAELYLQAAEEGYAPAQAALAFSYTLGLGIEQDKSKAEYWNQEAATGGNLMAMNNLAYEWIDSNRNLDKAMDLIKEVLYYVPDEPAYLDTYAWGLFKMGRYQDAIKPACTAVLNEPGSPEIRFHLGDILWRNGLKEQAILQWQTALDLTKNTYLLSVSGQYYVGHISLDQWNSMLIERLENGLPGQVLDPKTLPEDFFESTCLRSIS